MSQPFDLLLGRRTYEIFAAHWPYVRDDADPVAAGINNAKKYVASTTLTKLNWRNAELIEGDVATAVAGLKAQDGPEIQVHGSGGLIQTLLRHDLIDEFRLKIFPITLGRGKRLFAEGPVPAGFKLIESKVSPSGVIVATYMRAGDVRTGSFALKTPTEAELARRQRLAAEETEQTVTENRQTVERYLDGFRKGDHRQILSCLADDVEWEMPGTFRLTGKAAFDREIENAAFVGSPTITLTRMIEENDVVVAEGAVQCQRRDGGLLDAVFCDVLTMQNAKIKHLVSYLVELAERASMPE
jgi:dihydrofolate reductase/ketosteroid isomerase-like protein